ncbi:Mu transposase C-terminal domain-containing protein [Paenibacillus sediminis]
MLLVINTLIQYGEDENQIERILWMDAERNYCYVINIHSDRYPILKSLIDIEAGIKEGGILVVDQKNWFSLIWNDRLSEKAKDHLEMSWKVIDRIATEQNEPDIFIPHLRKQMIANISDTLGYSEKTVGRILRTFWKNGKTKQGLAPNFSNRGGKGKTKSSNGVKRGRPRKYSQSEGINISEEIEKIFRVALKKYYYTSKKAPLKFAYQKMIQAYFSEDQKIEDGVRIPIVQDSTRIPTYTQFKYFFKKENTIKREISTRYSSKKYELLHRPVLGNATKEAIGPGSKFLLDGTSFDIYLVSRINRNWIIGRPCLFYTMDVFSRVVTGMYIGLETSWLSAAMAIANSCEDKVSYCAKYGISIQPEEWESHHLPETILGDKGELFSKEVETLVENLHVKIENTSSYRGDLKSIIERHFRTTNDSVKMMLPGVINPDFRQRGPSSRDYRLDAKLDIYQFTQIIIRCVLHHNHHFLASYPREEMMIADDIESIPSVIWKWGVQYRSGKLREVPLDVVMLNMLPTAEALVSHMGIKFQGLFYGSATALKERWMEKARVKTWRVSVCYDPREIGKLYLRGVGDKGFEPCYLLSQHSQYSDRTKEEIEYLQAIENMQKAEHTEKGIQPQIDLITHIEAIVKDAEKLTKAQQMPSSKAEKLQGIREYRSLERQLIRENETYSMPVNQISSKSDSISPVSEDYFNDFDLFRQKQRERQGHEQDTDT